MRVLVSVFVLFLFFALSVPGAPTAWAQIGASEEADELPRVLELNGLNRRFLEQQRTLADDLVRINLGQRIRTEKADLALLQRLINAEVIDREDKESLQALGVVLGDVYTLERKELEWRVYEDELGKSHAVCIVGTKNCLFPITMLSRRIEAGLTPDVSDVYSKGLDELKPYLPKRPFLD